MSAGEIGIAALWKPLVFILGVIGTLIATIWGMLTARMKKQEESTEATKDNLNRNYYSKDETLQMIVLHTQPLKEALDANTRATEKLCEKIDRINRS